MSREQSSFLPPHIDDYVGRDNPVRAIDAYVEALDLEKLGFASGSMGPKVQAAIEFARNTGKDAVIGSLSDIVAIIENRAGTRVSVCAAGIQYRMSSSG